MVRGGFAVIMTRNIGTPSLAYQTPAGGMPSQSQLLSGFAETFSHYLCEVQPGGGSERLKPGGYAYILPGSDAKQPRVLTGFTRHTHEWKGSIPLKPFSPMSAISPV